MRMKLLRLSVVVLAGVVLASGCAHQLEVRDLNSYQNMQLTPLDKPLTIGIVPSAGDFDSQRLIKGVGAALGKYLATVSLPYSPTGGKEADVVASIAIRPQYRGSGWNFLINWPGFLIWAPAWHGYMYEANYDIGITLANGNDNSRIDSWSIPINLSLRHAETDRTWTEIGWLECGVIPFVGGIVFTQYDPDVTPILVDRISGPIGDYIAQEIVNRINSRSGFTRVVPATHPARTSKQDPPIVSYTFDVATGKGRLVVDIGGQGIAARHWVVDNIGKICSDKSITLVAGRETRRGGRYRVLNESVKDGLLSIDFEAEW